MHNHFSKFAFFDIRDEAALINKNKVALVLINSLLSFGDETIQSTDQIGIVAELTSHDIRFS